MFLSIINIFCSNNDNNIVKDGISWIKSNPCSTAALTGFGVIAVYALYRGYQLRQENKRLDILINQLEIENNNNKNIIEALTADLYEEKIECNEIK